MGRTDLTLKPFVDECLQKGYINFRKKDNLIEIVTPQYTRRFDPQYEEIFKMYERYCGREYLSYVKSRGALIQAMRKSKLYELLKPRPKHKYEFREKSSEEINNMSIKKIQKKRVNSKKIQKKRVNSKKIQKKRVDASPLTSGYESAECSPGIQNPVSGLSPSHILVQPDSDPSMPQIPEDIEKNPKVFQNSPNFSFPDIDDLDINMEEMESLKLSNNEQYEKLKEDILSDGVSSDELNEYLPDEDQSSDNIAECYGKSQGLVAGAADSWNICAAYGNRQAFNELGLTEDINPENAYPVSGNDGQILKELELTGDINPRNAYPVSGNDGQILKDFGLTGQINPYNGNLVSGNDGQILKDFGLTGQVNPYNGDLISGNDGQILKDIGLIGQINPYNGDPVSGNDGQILKDFGLTGQINPYNGNLVPGNGQILKDFGLTGQINPYNGDPVSGNDGQILKDFGLSGYGDLVSGNDGQILKDFGLTGQINPYNGDPVSGNDGQILKDFGLSGYGDPVSGNDRQILKGSGADQVDLLMDHTYSQQP